MNSPGTSAMLKHSISVRGRVELVGEKVRCEQRVTNGSVFSHDQHHKFTTSNPHGGLMLDTRIAQQRTRLDYVLDGTRTREEQA